MAPVRFLGRSLDISAPVENWVPAQQSGYVSEDMTADESPRIVEQAKECAEHLTPLSELIGKDSGLVHQVLRKSLKIVELHPAARKDLQKQSRIDVRPRLGGAVVLSSGGVTITRSASTTSVPSPSKAISGSKKGPRSFLQPVKTKRYPPPAFPATFYEKYSDMEPTYPYGKINIGKAFSKPTLVTSIRDSEEVSTDSIAIETKPLRLHTPPLLPETSLRATSFDFYSTTHYFHECPHSSPPATRPLNSQPYKDLHHSSGTVGEPRSMISGACFNCDLTSRQDRERLIIARHNQLICQTLHKLTVLKEDLKNLSLIVEDHNGKSYGVLVHEAEDVTRNVWKLDEQGEERLQARARDVRDIWKGFAMRWGPGTIAVLEVNEVKQPVSSVSLQGEEVKKEQVGKAELLESCRLTIEKLSESLEGGRMKVSWTR